MKRESKYLLVGGVMLGLAGITVYVENRDDSPTAATTESSRSPSSTAKGATTAVSSVTATGIPVLDRLPSKLKESVLHDPDFGDLKRLDEVCASYKSGDVDSLPKLRDGLAALENKWGTHNAPNLKSEVIASQIKKFDSQTRYDTAVWRFLDGTLVRDKPDWQEAMVKAMALKGAKPLCGRNAFSSVMAAWPNHKQGLGIHSCLWHLDTFQLKPFQAMLSGKMEKPVAPHIDLQCGSGNDAPVYSASMAFAMRPTADEAKQYTQTFSDSTSGKIPVNDWIRCERTIGANALLRFCAAIDNPGSVLGADQAAHLNELLEATGFPRPELEKVAKDLVAHPAVLTADDTGAKDRALIPLIIHESTHPTAELYLFGMCGAADTVEVTVVIESSVLHEVDRAMAAK